MKHVLVKANEMQPHRQKVYYPIERGKHAGLGPHPFQRVANQIVYPAMREAGFTNAADPAYQKQLDLTRRLVMAQMLANPEMHDLEFVNDPIDINAKLQGKLKGKTLEEVMRSIGTPGEDHASFMTPKQQRAAERENAKRSGKMSVSNLTDRTAGLSEKFKQMRDAQQARNAEKYGFPEPEGGKDAPAPDEKPKAPNMSAAARAKVPGVPDEMQGAFDDAGNLRDAGGPAAPEPDTMAQARAMLANMTPEQIQQLMSMGLATQRQTAVPTMRDPGEGGSDEMLGKASVMKYGPLGHNYVSPTGYGKDGNPNCRFCGSPNVEEVLDDDGNMNPVCIDCHMKRYADELGKAARQFRAHRAAFGDAWSLMKQDPYHPPKVPGVPDDVRMRMENDPYRTSPSQNNPYGQYLGDFDPYHQERQRRLMREEAYKRMAQNNPYGQYLGDFERGDINPADGALCAQCLESGKYNFAHRGEQMNHNYPLCEACEKAQYNTNTGKGYFY